MLAPPASGVLSSCCFKTVAVKPPSRWKVDCVSCWMGTICINRYHRVQLKETGRMWACGIFPKPVIFPHKLPHKWNWKEFLLSHQIKMLNWHNLLCAGSWGKRMPHCEAFSSPRICGRFAVITPESSCCPYTAQYPLCKDGDAVHEKSPIIPLARCLLIFLCAFLLSLISCYFSCNVFIMSLSSDYIFFLSWH